MLNKKDRKALRYAKSHGLNSLQKIRMQWARMGHTTIHYRYNIVPKVIGRFMGVNNTVCISKVVATPLAGLKNPNRS